MIKCTWSISNINHQWLFDWFMSLWTICIIIIQFMTCLQFRDRLGISQESVGNRSVIIHRSFGHVIGPWLIDNRSQTAHYLILERYMTDSWLITDWSMTDAWLIHNLSLIDSCLIPDWLLADHCIIIASSMTHRWLIPDWPNCGSFTDSWLILDWFLLDLYLSLIVLSMILVG